MESISIEPRNGTKINSLIVVGNQCQFIYWSCTAVAQNLDAAYNFVRCNIVLNMIEACADRLNFVMGGYFLGRM